MTPLASGAMVGLLMLATIGAYALARCLYLRAGQHPLLQPVFFGGLLLIACLLLLGRTVEDYAPARTLLTWPLGPATAALALPVYAQRARLRSACLPLLAGVVAGSLVTLATLLGIAALAGVSTPVLQSLAPKSVTAAIAVQLSRIQGGDPSLTAAAVVLTGMLGAILGPTLLSWARVRQPVARGIALGTISHAQGTAVALQEHEVSGAMSTLALVGVALLTSSSCPWCCQWLCGSSAAEIPGHRCSQALRENQKNQKGGTQPVGGLLAAHWLRLYRAGYRCSSEVNRRRRRG